MIRFYENNRFEFFSPGPGLDFDRAFINPNPHLGFVVFRGPRLNECFFPTIGKPQQSGWKNLYPHARAHILTVDFRSKEIVVDVDVHTPWGFSVEIRKMSFPLCLSIPSEGPGIRKWKEFVSTLNFEPKKHIPYLEELFYNWVEKRMLKGLIDFPSCLETIGADANQDALEVIFKEHLHEYLSMYDGKEYDTFAPEVFSPISYVDVESISAPGFKNYIRSLIKLSAKANCLSFFTRNPNDLPMSVFKAFCRHPRKIATFIDDPNIPECFYSVALFNLMKSPSVDSQTKNSAVKALCEWFCDADGSKNNEEELGYFQDVETQHLYLELLKQKSKIARYMKIGGGFYVSYTNRHSIPFRFLITINKTACRYEVFKSESYNPQPKTDDIASLFGDNPKAALFVILERCELVTETPSPIPDFSQLDVEFEKKKRDYDNRIQPAKDHERDEIEEEVQSVATEPESLITIPEKPNILRVVYALLLIVVIVLTIVLLVISKGGNKANKPNGSDNIHQKHSYVEPKNENRGIPPKQKVQDVEHLKPVPAENKADEIVITPVQESLEVAVPASKQPTGESAANDSSLVKPSGSSGSISKTPKNDKKPLKVVEDQKPDLPKSSSTKDKQQERVEVKPQPIKKTKPEPYQDDPLPRPSNEEKDYVDEPLPRPGGSK